MEKVVETKICKCGAKFDITDKDLEFYEKVSPVFGGKKYTIPSPTLCPDCRQQRRLSFRNERKLYKRKCDLTGKDIISIYSPDKPYKVYEQSEWRSDKWNPLDYGRDFDFSRAFFEQFKELTKYVPRISLFGEKNENSEYSNFEGYSKDCYLVFGGNNNKECLYGNYFSQSQNCMDGYWIFESNSSYNILFCNKVHNSISLEKCSDCSNCILGYDLQNCRDCLGCVGLRNKQYGVNNIIYDKSDYELALQNYLNNSEFRKDIEDKYEEIKNKFPRLNLDILNSEDCTGNNINNSKLCKNCYICESGNNSLNCLITGFCDDSIDLTSVGLSTLSYESISSGSNDFNNKSFGLLFISESNGSSNIIYSQLCHSSSNLFGCVGLRNKSYCILNKQYTKSEYEELVPKIIEHMKKAGEWGEFFPSYISPFGYNETVASEYFPITIKTGLKEEINYIDNEGNVYKSLEEAKKRPVFRYSTYEAPFPKVDKTIPASKLPENIKDIPDDILNWAIECEVSKKPFRIIKQELEFYRKHGLPIPRRHPDIRHLDRMALRNPRKIFDRKCYKCGINIKTTYSPERPEIVYCEDCYNKEVY